jgi:TRAP-type C4-dicarboxylate transport system permease large subunit
MIIVTGAVVLGHFYSGYHYPKYALRLDSRARIAGCGGHGYDYLHVSLGGLFMDSLAMVTLTIPIIYPLVTALGFDPIWFGVIIVLVTEMGVITPPVGINVYVIKGITEGVSLETIFKGIFPFLIAIIICVALLLAFPKIATFLPGVATY